MGGGGVSNVFLTYFDYFFGGQYKLGGRVERHQMEVKPPTPDKSSNAYDATPAVSLWINIIISKIVRDGFIAGPP